MSKTDKFLYSGFAAIAIAGLVAMLVSVFSPPKQTAEETVETPKIQQPTMKTASPPVDEPTQPEEDYVAYCLDDDGNKVWLTAEDIAESDAYEEEPKRQESERITQEKVEE